MNRRYGMGLRDMAPLAVLCGMALFSGGALAQGSQENMQAMPRLAPKRVYTATGGEDWEQETGFGKDSSMAEMITLMMVGGSGMEHMKMGAMKPGMKMAGMPGARGMGAGVASGLPLKVTVTPNPPQVGDNKLDVWVTDSSGKPVTGLKLGASVFMTSMDMGTTKPKATELGNGRYQLPVSFSMKGPWRVSLTGEGGNTSAGVRADLDFNVGDKQPRSLSTAQTAQVTQSNPQPTEAAPALTAPMPSAPASLHAADAGKLPDARGHACSLTAVSLQRGNPCGARLRGSARR